VVFGYRVTKRERNGMNKQPSDYKVGAQITFYDPHANQSITGIIREMDIPNVENWSQVIMRIETPERWETFYTDLFASSDLYWFGGDPESECTPEERGCYSIAPMKEHFIQAGERIYRISYSRIWQTSRTSRAGWRA
jgi:hypothetical protein